MGAPAERADSRMRAAAARARAHRARVGADRAARAQDRRPQSARGVRAADHAARWPRGRRRRRGRNGWIASTALAPRVLLRPDRVLRVLADLRPMGAVGPVTLDEAARVLADRLASIESRPAAAALRPRPRRQPGAAARPQLRRRLHPGAGRADVSAEAARGSAAARRGAAAARRRACRVRPSARSCEKLQLRLAVGAAESRLYVSFPTVEIGEGRPRVPSLYALEVWRAMTGRVPSADELQQAAARDLAARRWRGRRRPTATRRSTRSSTTVDAARAGRRARPPRARPRALHPPVERMPAALRARAVHARQARRGRTGTASPPRPSASSRFSRRSARARGATRCRRCRSTPSARISSCSARSTGCGRRKISSRCSAWIR